MCGGSGGNWLQRRLGKKMCEWKGGRRWRGSSDGSKWRKGRKKRMKTIKGDKDGRKYMEEVVVEVAAEVNVRTTTNLERRNSKEKRRTFKKILGGREVEENKDWDFHSKCHSL